MTEATDKCKWCGDEFANHNYVFDSIDEYQCSEPISNGLGWGIGYFTPIECDPDKDEDYEYDWQNYFLKLAGEYHG